MKQQLEPAETPAGITVDREFGGYISRLEQYRRSLKYFDQAIEKTPDDVRALIGRAKARAKCIHYNEASEDIAHALSLEPDNIRVLESKALNTYLCCEFEEGLVQNTRLLPRRRKPENFSMGVMHCFEAIENCIGERTGHPLRDHFRIIRRLAWKKNYAAQKPFEPQPTGKKQKKPNRFRQYFDHEELEAVQPRKARLKDKKSMNGLEIINSLHSKKSEKEFIPRYDQPFPFNPLQNYTSNIENFMAEKYLQKTYLDKIFLKQLMTDKNLSSPNKAGTENLKRIIKTCYKDVSYKQELLRARRPFYFHKYQQVRLSGAIKERRRIELEHQQFLCKKEADSLLKKGRRAYVEKRLKDLLKDVETLKRYLDRQPKKLLPNKAVYMREIYDTVCKAFYDVYRLNPKHSMYDEHRRIYATLGLALSREPSTDSVVVQFKNVFVDHRGLIQLFERRLVNAVVPEEICWFYHELARLNLEQRKFDLARLYARKCIEEAKSIQNEMWIFNSAMLMCKNDIQQRNLADAKQRLQVAMKSALKLRDQQKIEYINKCADILDNLDFDPMEIKQTLDSREKHIIKMMADTQMKDEVSHLFRQMAAMPPSRRMTVIPGLRSQEKEPKKGGRSMSIMPGRKEDRESLAMLKKTISRTDVNNKSIMSLIDLHL